MKRYQALSGILLLCASFPVVSNAATLDIRGGYRSGSHAYETRLKVSEGWQNGWWASLESN
ncbi:N-acetylneuraminic acid channel protein, partial [Escherichia coli]|nr:N-acetylneuraminic acid channel protein [Escherichia coli]